jgi:hypothetical protein
MAQVSEALMPSFCSSFCGLKPRVSVGTMKADKPFLPSSGSVTAKTIATAARLPLVTNCLLPLRIQRPSRSTARVFKLLASLPACGSVRQKQPILRPAAMSGSQAFFCASLPQVRIGPQPTELWTLINAAVEAQPAAISSIASAYAT